jgi:hypothetical protein
VQISIVQFVLVDDVAIEPIELLFGQKLAGEETRTAETFEASAVGADAC